MSCQCIDVSRPIYSCWRIFYVNVFDVSRPIYSCRRIFHANVLMYLGLYTHADVYFMPMYQCINVSWPIYSCKRIFQDNVSMYLGLYTHVDVYFMPMYQCIKAYILIRRCIFHANVSLFLGYILMQNYILIKKKYRKVDLKKKLKCWYGYQKMCHEPRNNVHLSIFWYSKIMFDSILTRLLC